MRLVFHHNQISGRGDTSSILNFSRMLESLGIECMVTFPPNSLNDMKRVKDLRAKGLKVENYSSIKHLHQIARNFSASHAMFVNDGRYSNLWIPNAKNLVHATFNNYEPYGDAYGYISEWLYRKALRDKKGGDPSESVVNAEQTKSPYHINYQTKITWVPHTVFAFKGDGESFRLRHEIPRNAFLVGRVGGYHEFSDNAAKCALERFLTKHRDSIAVFVNTKPFLLHNRISYLGYITDEEKWDFYDACDVLINARLMGEGFGYSIVEPLMLGKPVIAPSRKRNRKMDANHIEILKPLELLYDSEKDFESKLLSLKNNESRLTKRMLVNSVKMYRPEIVAQRFKSEFLD